MTAAVIDGNFGQLLQVIRMFPGDTQISLRDSTDLQVWSIFEHGPEGA